MRAVAVAVYVVAAEGPPYLVFIGDADGEPLSNQWKRDDEAGAHELAQRLADSVGLPVRSS